VFRLFGLSTGLARLNIEKAQHAFVLIVVLWPEIFRHVSIFGFEAKTAQGGDNALHKGGIEF
jgi:hypothetical protein